MKMSAANNDAKVNLIMTSEEEQKVTSNSCDVVKQSKKYYTASDMMSTMTTAMHEFTSVDSNTADFYAPQVELHKRMPDGTTIPVDNQAMKATDAQMMLKQTADRISCLGPEEKLEWAKHQRLEGNQLFSEQKYQKAMDIYLTCLVAIDFKTADDNNNSQQGDLSRQELIERDIQLPVLLNLAACALKLSQYSKVEQFCNIALTDLSLSKSNAKVWYRRGKARMHKGQYGKAADDFKTALKLVNTDAEKVAIQKDIHKLTTLRKAAKDNRNKYEMAMKTVFQGGGGDEHTKRLYDDHECKPGYSTLKSSSNGRSSTIANQEIIPINTETSSFEEIGLIGWVYKITGECFRRLIEKVWPKCDEHPIQHVNLKKKI